MTIGQPVVYDAQLDTDGDPVHEISIPNTLTKASEAPTGDANSAMLGVTDDQGTAPETLTSFLNDPSTVYPVTIDPSIAVSQSHDTWIEQGDKTSHDADYNLKIGADGSNIRRALMLFNVPGLGSGWVVANATLKVFQTNGATCTAEPVNAFPATSSWSGATTWSTRPTVTGGSYTGSGSFSHGYSSSGCPNGYGSVDVTNMVSAWSSYALPNYGMDIQAGTESAAVQDKTFCSMNPSASAPACNTSAHVPTMSMTYYSIPGTPTGSATYLVDSQGNKAFQSTTPTIQASSNNPDGTPVSLSFQVMHNASFTSENDSTYWSTTVPAASNQVVSVTVPAGVLTDHHHYDIVLGAAVSTPWGQIPNNWGNSSGPYDVDVAVPSPQIGCPGYPNGAWTPQVSGGVTCTLSGPSDLVGFYYSWDSPDPTTLLAASNGAASVTAPTTPGRHQLYAYAVDGFGRPSKTAVYAAEIGVGGLLTPADWATTQSSVALTAQSVGGTNGFNEVAYQYRLGTTGAFTPIPTGDVTPAQSGTSFSTWPQAGTANGSVEDYPALTWNLAHTVHAAGGSDGPIQVQACFDNADPAAPTCTNINTVLLSANSFTDSAATQTLGPGVVSLDTGDFEVQTSDASEAGMSVGHTATSLRMGTPANNIVDIRSSTGIFGPGWRASLPGAGIGAGDDTLADHSADGYLTLTGSDGNAAIYQGKNSGHGPSATYVGVGDANDGSTISCDNPTAATCTSWTLTDIDGTKTTWTNPNSQPAWTVSTVVAASTDTSAKTNTTSFTRDATGRVTRILAPVPDGVTCGVGNTVCNASTADADLRTGAQALKLNYATTSTTGLSSTVWGDYAGLVSGISYLAAEPTTGTMTSTQIAAFAYDDTGHLRASWDPRITPALKTTYDYDTSGRLIHITSPGRATWTMAYDDQGRIASVSRPDPTNGIATQEVVYGINPDGSTNGTPNLTGGTTPASAAWGQATDLPITGAAIFPASHTLGATNSHGDHTPSATDWPYGNLSYVDVNGRMVNHAAYGAGAWQIDSTRYDINGNAIWALSSLNRQRALTPDDDTDPLVKAQTSSAQRADMLSSVWVYTNADVGAPTADLIDTYGPLHQARLASGTTASVRTATTYAYDEGAPAGLCPCHLVTTTETAPLMYGQTTAIADQRYTTTGYDPVDGSSNTGPTSGWILRQPTTQTTVMNGNTPSSADLTTKTAYNAQGQVVSTQLPGSSGSDAGTTTTSYYTATGTGTCGGKPAWAGLACQVGPAAQPTGTTIPSAVRTYDRYLNSATVTQTSATSTRTTTTTYDAGERPITTSITISPAADAGTPVPDATTSYDPATGDAISVATGAGSSATTITKAYNSLGQETSYTDADGATTTSTYDIDGNPKTVNDAKGTYTYTYDGTDAAGHTEHRGLLTKVDTGMTSTATNFAGSTFTGAYDADGNLITENYPNGVVATTHYDDTGDPRSLTYAKNGTTWLNYTSISDGFGETVAQSSPSSTQQFHYDADGRLTTTVDDYQGTCTTRTYGFSGSAGKDSDRTSLATSAPGAPNSTGTCPTGSGGTTVIDTFDTADHITSSGYSYDKFGRTLTIPANGLANNGATGSGTLTMGYYANDMVASQAQGTKTTSFTLDPASRVRGMVDTAAGAETRRTLNHYGDDSDSPSWIATSTNAGSSWTWKRSVVGPDGNLAALQESDTSVLPELQLTNLHGDIAATVKDDTTAVAPDSTSDITEYGVPRDPTTTPARYSWIGGKRRSSDDLADLVLMGVRLYNPTTGRFLSVDPIPGGNANPYTYPTNPIDGYDLTGQWSISGIASGLKKGATKAVKTGYNAAKSGYHYVTTHKAYVATTAAGIAGGVICGASVVCGVAVGAGAGLGEYAATHRGGTFSPAGAALATVKGGASGGIGSAGKLAKLRLKYKHVGPARLPW
jgi:RHS repeat-associated protein